MKNSIVFLIIVVLSSQISIAQKTQEQPTYTAAKTRLESFNQRKKLEENSLVSNVKFRSVGPTIMSGRIVDVDVSPDDPTHFYVAYASGGLWKTINNGLSFTPIFDNEAVITIGDIAVDWKHGETIWIGTGENNSSRSSYSGVGVYKSSDGGKTWEHKGLEESHHIGRIILHPTDPNTIWVASLGHLFSANKERGIYKTTDGGKTWKQTLYKDENTGAIDLIIDPGNPNILYTALWHRERRAWNFTESGKTSGIYKSTDAGETWTLLTNEASGFPFNEGVGRIGLTISPKNTNILYAIVDNENRRAKEKKEDKNKITKDTLRTISKENFLKINDTSLTDFLEKNEFPTKYSAKRVKEMVQKDSIKPIALVEYLEDANSLLFDTPVIGAQVYRSDDAGKTWKKTHEKYLDDLFYSYGYYFGQIRVSPNNSDKIYIVGVTIVKSEDGGKTFKSMDGDNVHGDFHGLWLDPNKEGHLVIGNDGGLNITYDDGAAWFKANTPAVGQFYSVNVDMETPYNVYGGIQDNGVWYGPSNYKASNGWQQSGKYPYQLLLWGDGMQVAIDTRDNNTVYTGFQFGNYFSVNKKTGETKPLQIEHQLGERPLRFNWQTPVWLSKHNQDILYMGSNKFHRSMNKGEKFETLSGDLTKGGKKGDVAYGTLTAIHESPLKFGLIYVGSDDGLIHVSKDGGYNWIRISDKLPQDLWVRRITASAFNEGTVYVCLSGHTFDHFASYLYASKDFGTSWEKIGTDLPLEPVNVVREDPKNANIIYVGTDQGLYVSINKGKNFMRMSNGLPAVAVHDLVIHPRDNDLVIGTHGRSIYIANVEYLQQLTDTVLSKEIHCFNIKPVKYNNQWGKNSSAWEEPVEYKCEIPFYSKTTGKTTITVQTEKGLVLKQIADTSEKGLNYLIYDLSIDSTATNKYQTYLNENKKKEAKEIKVEMKDNKKYYLEPGKYNVYIENSNRYKIKSELMIKEK